MVISHIVDLHKRQSPIPSGGTEIKLKLHFRLIWINLVEKLRGLIQRYQYDLDDRDLVHEAPSTEDEDDGEAELGLEAAVP